MIYRIADIVNSRPLTYVPSDDTVQPLTPNHFLRLGPCNINSTLEMHPRLPRTETGVGLTRLWQRINKILDIYWEHFQHEYLAGFRERHTVTWRKSKGSRPSIPSPGDVVLVSEPHTPRSEWKIGIIDQVDKRQALANVIICKCGKTLDDPVTKTTVFRSIQQLYPLELINDHPLPLHVPYPRLPRRHTSPTT